MTQAVHSAIAPGTQTAPARPTGEAGLNDRAAALMARMASSGDDDKGLEVEEMAAPVDDDSGDVAPSADAADAPGEPAAPKTAKDERLAKLGQMERAQVERRQKARDEYSRREQEIAIRHQQVEHAARQVADRDKIWDDPQAVLSMLEEKVGVDKLVAYFAEAKNPAKLAAREAKKDLEPLAQQVAELRAENAAFKHAQATAAVETEFKGVISQFANDDAKFTARALAKNERKVIDRAHAIANELRGAKKNFNLYDIANILESEYRDVHAMLNDSAGLEPTDETTRNEEISNGATGKAKTISNRAASSRTAIAANGGTRMSLEDRAEAAKRRLRNA